MNEIENVGFADRSQNQHDSLFIKKHINVNINFFCNIKSKKVWEFRKLRTLLEMKLKASLELNLKLRLEVFRFLNLTLTYFCKECKRT